MEQDIKVRLVGIGMHAGTSGWLHQVDSRVILQDFNERRPSTRDNSVAYGDGIGQLLTRQTREYLEFSLKFTIAETDPDDHIGVLLSVIAWAQTGGTLYVNYRPGMKADVVCCQLPEIGYARDWAKEYQIVFRAYDVPFWQSSVDSATTMQSGVQRTVQAVGNYETPLNLIVESATGATGDIVISYEDDANTYGMTFENITIGGGFEFEITHSGRLLLARVSSMDGYVSVLANRTVESSDEIMIPVDTACRLTVTAPDGCTITAITKGRWN